MVKKYKGRLEVIIKRNKDFFNTKVIASRLNDKNIKDLENSLKSNLEKINRFILDKGFKIQNNDEHSDYNLAKEVSQFLKRKKELETNTHRRRSKFDLSILESMFDMKNYIYPNSKIIRSRYEIFTNSKPPSKSHISQILNKKLKIRYKKQSFSHLNTTSECSKIQKLLFIHKLSQDLSDKKNLIYIDATKFKNDKNSQRFWQSSKGTYKFFNNGRVKGLNVLGALSEERILYLHYCVTNVDTNEFLTFLKKLEENIINLDIKDPLLIIDNCAYQKGKEVKKFVKTSIIKMLFLPCYYPSYNAIEYLWNILKKHCRNEIITKT